MSTTMSTLAKYYLLCTARVGEKRHIIDRIPDEQFMAIFTKKEKNLFFRQHDGLWIARETIVGGNDPGEITPGRGQIIII